VRSHDNRDRSRGCHGGRNRLRIMRNDDIGAESDKFLGVLLGTIASPVGIAKLDLDVFTIRVAEGV
jgi:hypothetical protein